MKRSMEEPAPGRDARPSAAETTDLLLAWRDGDRAALGRLIPRLYRQLHEIARHLMRREDRDHTLHATALVHEAYLRVVELERIDWRDRAHFLAICSRLMRRVLIDHARRKKRLKRPARGLRIELGEAGPDALSGDPAPEVSRLDEALRELARLDLERARVVELRYFGGLDREQIAAVLGISSATVTRRWRSARAWLIAYFRPEASWARPIGA